MLLVCPNFAATSVATVGDSFADTFYYGMRSRPDLLKQYDIQLVRWSRPMIGLTRTDQFDYAAWLRESADLGVADFCVVQLGANDLQSIPAGPGQWVRFPGEEWKAAYSGRAGAMLDILRTQRCRRVMWMLQPGFERSGALGRNRQMINELQIAGLASGNALVFDIAAGEGDYGRDGIHFNGPFALKLGDAVMRTVAAWRQRIAPGCYACHTQIRMPAPELRPLQVHAGSSVNETVTHIAGSVPPRSAVVQTKTRVVATRHRRRRPA
jgi:hypothetical protein